MKLFVSIAMVTLASWAGAARGAYMLDPTTAGDLGDFQFAQIGTFGSSPGSHNSVEWTGDDAYRFQGRYNQQAARALMVSGDAGSTVGYYAESVYASLGFRYYNGDATTVNMALGLRAAKNNGFNNYPIYYVQILSGTLQLVKKWGYNATTEQTTLGSYAVGALGGAYDYTLQFNILQSDTNAFGEVLDLQINLLQGETMLTSLSYQDTPSALSGANSTFAGGYAVIAAGAGPANNGTMRGIDVTSFSLLSSQLPEPGSALLFLGGLALLARRIWTRELS